ncbi:MAG: branched-chain amino acid aminotransferase [candidate division KSB1 bacterium]|nr:branched-chain amino acid aminotransferase [candidate division KSB1 bacterium]MDZ7275706.1 branched-chain amino acid aminotransferase [candidate division KSB1 bacterium]MDZ7284603.1 branched-chain amino acid aminotransferase [candidate division KSB1 bacterium]MDZ7297978.1 branched-chain amino acid aminotransferase [candidate division KSB1 bacterium]MDZ7305854.1 branched-chain amino acid aminotransferase [candidate division KSB1 bacterium]
MLTKLDAVGFASEAPEVVPLPVRKLLLPELDHLAFDVYQTSRMYLACHMTSHLPDENQHWPAPCLELGWEHYYSDDYRETGWSPPGDSPIIPLQQLALHPACCALHYGAAAFEGTKAFVSAKGRVVLFRIRDNARRLQKSASRLLLPKVPVEMFLQAVADTVLANREFIPPYRAANWAWETRNPHCLYVRPVLIGHGPQLGVRPSKDHLFLIFVSPVRAYYPVEGMSVLISSYFRRTAPGGTGGVKTAGNYAAGLLPAQLARQGCDWVEGKPVKVSQHPFHDVLYLDARHGQYVEEFSGANLLAVSTSGTLLCPESETILPGITRASVMTLARDLGIPVEQRPLPVDELMDDRRITEVFCTGNAAVITPIVSLHYQGRTRKLTLEKYEITRRLWQALVGVQLQTAEDRHGWVEEIG